MDLCPIQKGEEILLVGDECRLDGPLGSYADFTLLRNNTVTVNC